MPATKPRAKPEKAAGKAAARKPPAAKARRDYGGVGHLQRAEERRERLLETALELFARQGYAKTPIEQLCAEARVTARHFYELFDSREALLAALYARIIDELRQAVLAALSAPAASRDSQIADAVHALIHHYVDDARRARIGVLEVVGVSPVMEQQRRGVIHGIASLIESYINRLVGNGQLPPRNYHLLSVALVGGVNELLAEWLTVAKPPSIAVLTEEITLLFLALLSGGSTLFSTTPNRANR